MPKRPTASAPAGASLVDAFIRWAVNRAPHAQGVVTFEGAHLFDRYEFIRKDEWPDSWWDEHRLRHEKAMAEGRTVEGYDFRKRPNALPWWLPFNAFVHRWNTADGVAESFHDHPRWTITVCLKGRIIERTPWGERLLKAGSLVIRSRKAIHAFKTADAYAGEVWTLFIVGRRKARQNTYVITAR